jgi:hypothetical protein
LLSIMIIQEDPPFNCCQFELPTYSSTHAKYSCSFLCTASHVKYTAMPEVYALKLYYHPVTILGRICDSVTVWLCSFLKQEQHFVTWIWVCWLLSMPQPFVFSLMYTHRSWCSYMLITIKKKVSCSSAIQCTIRCKMLFDFCTIRFKFCGSIVW